MTFGNADEVTIRIDLVLHDNETQQAICVLDTKYKDATTQSAAADLEQVVAYAVAQSCTQAALVYPGRVTGSSIFQWGGVTVRRLGFSIAEDLDSAGEAFLADLESAAHPI